MRPATTYVNANGKTVERYEIEAASLHEALDRIPGDFKVCWWNQDDRSFSIEIVRMF